MVSCTPQNSCRIKIYNPDINTMKNLDTVSMPKPMFVREHKHLIKLLKNPTAKGLTKEVKAQTRELVDVMKRNR